MKNAIHDFSTQAHIRAADVKGQRPGRSQKIIHRV
jgi:hypothetical protein